MAQEHDKNNLLPALMILLAMLVLLIIGDYLVFNGFFSLEESAQDNEGFMSASFAATMHQLFARLSSQMIMVRGLYTVLLISIAYLNPSFKLGRNMDQKDKIIYYILASTLSILFILGYTRFEFYNIVLYPVIFILTIFLITRAVALLRKNFKDEDFFKGVSCLKPENDFYFDFNTEKGKMRVHVPQENIFIDGGPGSGKSHFVIKHILFQSALRQYAGFVYDYEGDPTKKGNPLLSQVVYSAITHAKQNHPVPGEYKLRFAFINFTDMTRTVRVNVLSEKYFSEYNAQMYIDNLATTLMKNLEPSWKEKTDFWAGNAINFVSSVMYLLYKNHRTQGYNTIPHAISVCLCDSDTVFNWMSEDPEISKTMSAMLTAWKLGANQQTAGAVSSAQLPLRLLYKKYIYWVLSADEFSLDVSNKDNPYLLCVGNSPELKEAISPAISVIVSTLMSQMNNPDKQKSIFCVDELPTINMFGIDRFISTARKHYVSTILAVQDFMQLVRDYGDKSANTIRTSCGTLYQGKTGNNKTAEEIVKMLGEIKRTNVSYSEQSSGGMSTSESQQREKILQEREIAGQESGHFFVKISNGKPPFAFTGIEGFHKVKEYKNHELPPFALKIKTGDTATDLRIMEELVSANFYRIEKEIGDMLAPFQRTE